ncbi:hypothetical protein [Maioricimonas rarisocia]|uniref:hypothetical protein n=1 Tax=Maioricimonas rarisocia TaxID=2528026 RepID=UPI0011A18953|nr:hypothetical protein [Maioricimonas rarisocia]
MRRQRRCWNLWIASPDEFPFAADDRRAQTDLILFAVDHPDDIGIDVDAAWADAPLTRWLICRADWCDSTGRTRDRWPQSAHVPVSALAARLELEFDVLQNRRTPAAITADRNEVFAFGHPATPASPLQGVTVAWDGPDPTLGESVLAACRAAGAQVATSSVSNADVLLFDGDPWTATRQDALGRLTASVDAPAVVVQFGYLRLHQRAEALALGACAAIEKLVPEQELFDAILSVANGD